MVGVLGAIALGTVVMGQVSADPALEVNLASTTATRFGGESSAAIRA